MTCKHLWGAAFVALYCCCTQTETRADYEYFNEADTPTSVATSTSASMPASISAPGSTSAAAVAQVAPDAKLATATEDCPTCAAGCDCASAGASCGEMPSCIDERDPCWMCIAGAEATYLAPHFAACGCPPGQLMPSDYANVDGIWEVGARIWFGFENDNGNGIRARYWQTQGSDTYANVETPNLINYDTIVAFEKLDVYTIDLEYTKRFDCDCWDLLGSAGVRYASLNRNQGFSNYSENNGYVAWTDANYDYHGTGLTFGLEGRHPLGDSCFSLFASGRGSVLWGPSKQAGQSLLETSTSTGYQLAEIEDDSNTAWIFETQVGLEWAKYLECFNGTAFARFMFEYQHWNIDSHTYSLNQNLGGTSLQLDSLSPDMELYGVTFAVGVTR